MYLSGSALGLKPKTKQEFQKFQNSGIDYVHIDVMDGIFVSNESFPINQVQELISNGKYDVHLMVKDVKKYINEFKNINPKYITFHYELDNTLENIQEIKKNNIKVGLAINPNTEIEEIYPYLSKIDLVLIMSVEPGLGGQSFITNTYEKINKLYQYREENKLDFLIEVDGGVKDTNISNLKKCDIVVVGSYITNDDYKIQVEKLKKMIN